jgi:hypothetical protein
MTARCNIIICIKPIKSLEDALYLFYFRSIKVLLVRSNTHAIERSNTHAIDW